ncbi:hypothetical protein K505DRAFT_365880 [Melanomma pulvis-pyrius CBS 109.77]|uniref:Uncharacterized protein n=1 Tax=Melanomma pulvis-pyrius CBS 109.77 TaxID=1314802 RepID=A0A6A6WZK7_9PLEO|nr:hypothetical protein K505DRAFT_365880 [Melanomma pulvis-pyrius CBS 109.77]
MNVTTKTTIKEVRRESGYDEWQWAQFYAITGHKARLLFDFDKHPNWIKVPKKIKKSVKGDVAAYLEDQGIPLVSDQVLDWRMTHSMRARMRYASISKVRALRAANWARAWPRRFHRFDPIRDI